MKTIKKLGADLSEGDALTYGSELKTITHFKPHNGLVIGEKHYPARVAKCGPLWGMTVFDDDWYEVADTKAR